MCIPFVYLTKLFQKQNELLLIEYEVNSHDIFIKGLNSRSTSFKNIILTKSQFIYDFIDNRIVRGLDVTRRL